MNAVTGIFFSIFRPAVAAGTGCKFPDQAAQCITAKERCQTGQYTSIELICRYFPDGFQDLIFTKKRGQGYYCLGTDTSFCYFVDQSAESSPAEERRKAGDEVLIEIIGSCLIYEIDKISFS